MTNQTRLKKYLHQIINDEPVSLAAAVAAVALEYGGEEVTSFFSDLLRHGCQSGMVSTLIYYHDTHKFYDTHYDEIEQLRDDLESEFGQPLQPKGDLKNWFAWLAFEETARLIFEQHTR